MSKLYQIEIKKDCRELHGVDGALDKAFEILRDRFKLFCPEKDSTNKTFRLELHIDKQS